MEARDKYSDGLIQKVDDQGICLPFLSTYMLLENETQFFIPLTKAKGSFGVVAFQFQTLKSAEMNWLKMLGERKMA